MPSYIRPRVTIEPGELLQRYIAEMQAQQPGWTPNDAEPDTIIPRALSFIASQLGEELSDTLDSVFRWFLANMANIPPIDATASGGLATVVFSDTAGHTIPAGDLVVALTVGDDLIGFENDDDIVIAPGNDTATGVSFTARETGTLANDLTGLARQVEAFSFVGTVTFTSTTSDGADAEEDDDYLDRGRGKLQLSTDTPILGRDFAILAKDVAGVTRALFIDGFDATDNEIQSITVNATGGTFPLTWNGQTATGVAYNATAAQVKTALESLSNIEPGDVVTAGGPLATAPVTVEFKGQYLNTNVALMSSTSAGLTGGTSTASFATTRAVTSVYDSTNTATWALGAVTGAGLDADGVKIGPATKTAVDVYLQSLREVGFKVSIIDPIETTIGVLFDFTTWDGFDSLVVKDDAEEATRDYLSGLNWGRPPFDNPTDWIQENKVRASEVHTVLNGVDGLKSVTALTLSGGTASGADRLLAGSISIPIAGTITGTPA